MDGVTGKLLPRGDADVRHLIGEGVQPRASEAGSFLRQQYGRGGVGGDLGQGDRATSGRQHPRCSQVHQGIHGRLDEVFPDTRKFAGQGRIPLHTHKVIGGTVGHDATSHLCRDPGILGGTTTRDPVPGVQAPSQSSTPGSWSPLVGRSVVAFIESVVLPVPSRDVPASSSAREPDRARRARWRA